MPGRLCDSACSASAGVSLSLPALYYRQFGKNCKYPASVCRPGGSLLGPPYRASFSSPAEVRSKER